MKNFLLTLSLSLTALIGFSQCDTEASFEYELIDGIYHFTNTSTGEDEFPLYEWTVDGDVWSDDENPTLGGGDIVDGTVICLEVSDEETACVDEYCLTFELEEEPCEVTASFEYDLIDGTYHFYNTSEGEGDTPIFEWSVDGVVWSDDENPTLGGGDIEDGSIICFTVSTGDGDLDCSDEICMEIEVDPCELHASFEYEIIDGVYHFYNTSTGEWDGTTYSWTLNGDFWTDEENPTIGEADIEEGAIICLHVFTHDGEIECEDDVCIEIGAEDPCELHASFEYELIDGVYHFYNTSTGEWVETSYLWTVDGELWADDENPTLGEGDVGPGTVICLHVNTHDGDIECEDEVCIVIGEEDPCELHASFEYELIDGIYHFYNTSTGEWVETSYQWTVDGDLWSDDENPTLGEGDVGPGTVICLHVNTHDGELECADEICIVIGEEDPCELDANFEYELIDGVYHFYNTSTGEWVGTTYLWTLNGDDWSDDENPTLGEDDAEPGTVICLYVFTHDGDIECEDHFCIEIGEEGPCELHASFEFELSEGAYHFYNTSTGELDESNYHWYLNGDVWSELENPTLGEGDVEPGTEVCLLVFTNDDILECEDDVCYEFGEDLGLSADEQSMINIYPNPVHDIVTIQSTEGVQIEQIEIYNAIGELVAIISNSATSQSISIDLSELETGIYFIHLLNTSGTYMTPQQIVKY